MKYLSEYDKFVCGPYAARGTYPRFSPNTCRRDAWPPGGGLPGSDVDFMREQHLDANNIAFGVLEPLLNANIARNHDAAAAFCTAMNEWQKQAFYVPEPRLRASILVPQDDAEAAVKEIEAAPAIRPSRRSSSARRPREPLGRKRYWPIFAAAQANNLSIGLHIGGTQSSAPVGRRLAAVLHRGSPHAGALDAEPGGEPDPGGRVRALPEPEGRDDRGRVRVGADAGVAAGQPLEEDARRGAALKRPPSEYMRSNIWFATQPVEEPENPEDLRQVFEWIGWDRIVYSSDYPHWDYDDPRQAWRIKLTPQEERVILRDNALQVYNFR